MTKLELDLFELLQRWLDAAAKPLSTGDARKLVVDTATVLRDRPAPRVFITAEMREQGDKLRAAGFTWDEVGEALDCDGDCLRKSMARYGYKPHGQLKRKAT